MAVGLKGIISGVCGCPEQKLLISTIRPFIKSDLKPPEDKVGETGELALEDTARILVCSKDIGSYAIAFELGDVDHVRDRTGVQIHSTDYAFDQYKLDDSRGLVVFPCGLR